MSDNKLYFTHQMFLDSVKNLAGQIYGDKFSYICAIPRGGLALALYLSHQLWIPTIDFSVVKSAKDVPILFVEDVVDSGDTITDLKKQGIIGHLDRVASLVYKPLSIVKPDYWAVVSDAWIVFEWENVNRK